MKGNTKVAKICKIDFVELFKRAPLYLGGGKRKEGIRKWIWEINERQ